MSDIPYIAIGNDELGPDLEPTIRCPLCNQNHPVECSSSDPRNDGSSISLQFYKCGERMFLAGINGQSLNR